MIKKVEIRGRQSLQDITIQEAGSMEALFMIALRHNISITDDVANYPEDLDAITITNNNIISRRNVNYYSGHGIKPATGITDEEVDAILPELEGIDYWIVTTDDLTAKNEIIIQ